MIKQNKSTHAISVWLKISAGRMVVLLEPGHGYVKTILCQVYIQLLTIFRIFDTEYIAQSIPPSLHTLHPFAWFTKCRKEFDPGICKDVFKNSNSCILLYITPSISFDMPEPKRQHVCNPRRVPKKKCCTDEEIMSYQ